jgi:AAA+ ATPase superfamily predicted ATPase
MSEQTEIQAPNIHPNPKYYIEREDEIKRVENYIKRAGGAVIGLTGVRGAGKSSVIEKIVAKYDKKYFTLTITSPTGYDEKAFFRMVFRRLCEEVNKKIEEALEIRTTLKEIAKSEIKKYRILFFILFFIPLVLVLLAYFRFFFSDILFFIPTFSFITLLIGYITLLSSLFLSRRILKEITRARKFPKMVGLHILTKDILETLKYEKTISYEAKVGIISHISSFFKIGKELTTRPFTLPGLTSEYNDYISKVIDTFGGKAIICIDELDKITDPEQVKNLLRGIKGALFQKNCYYLISISEDAVKSFKTRVSAERDMLESTFDEIIDLDRINLDIARKISKKWLEYEDVEKLSPEAKMSIDMISVLSGGIPRELIRNLREVSMEFGKDINPIKAWKILFVKKISDFKKEVKLSSINEDIKTEIYDIGDQLAPANLFNRELNNMALKLRESVEELYKTLESWNSDEKKKVGKEMDNEKKKIAKEIDKLQKSTLELKIYAVIFEYLNLKRDVSNGEEFLHNLLKAYSMLPYNKKLSHKYINDAIIVLNAKSLS